MNTVFRYSILILAIIIVSVPARSAEDIVTGQVIVKIKNGADIDNVLRNRSAGIADSLRNTQTYLVSFSPDISAGAFIEDLLSDPDVLYAEPNYRMILPESFQMSISFPDDDRPPLLNGISPADYFEQPAVYTIGADAAAAISSGNGITVAVIDNGLDYTHPLFEGALADGGYDFLDNDDQAVEESGVICGHGTFVSGLIRLTAPGARLLPLRAFDGNGIGNCFAVARAIEYAVENKVLVINMSFGMFNFSHTLKKACTDALSDGVSLVAAAGNNSSADPMYPAALQGVIAVSAIDASDVFAGFSNYGEHIVLCAPGVNLYSALAGEYQWGTWSGTSFAAPLVSATAAMKLAQLPNLGPGVLEEILIEAAAMDLSWGTVVTPSIYYGYGRIDAAAAVAFPDISEEAICGDTNGDGIINCGDIQYLVRYLDIAGPDQASLKAADVNGDGLVNQDDVDYLTAFVFGGGPTPDCP